MSRGPLPAEVYWRRRFLLLAALLLVAWGVVTVWPAGGETETAAEAPEPSASTEASASPSTSPEPEEAEAKAREATVSLTAGGDPCDPETIRMSPHVPPDQTTKNEVTIQLTMSTSAEEPCTFQPKAGDIAAVVSADGNAVWDSDVCRDATIVDGPVELTPQWSTVATATWTGRGSGPACAKDEGWASPGKYALRIGTLGGEPGKTTFRLESAPEKKKQETSDEDAEKNESDDAGAEDEDESVTAGSLILVNGPSSAGKSTLCRAAQPLLPRPFLHHGLDAVFFGDALARDAEGRPRDWPTLRRASSRASCAACVLTWTSASTSCSTTSSRTRRDMTSCSTSWTARRCFGSGCTSRWRSWSAGRRLVPTDVSVTHGATSPPSTRSSRTTWSWTARDRPRRTPTASWRPWRARQT